MHALIVGNGEPPSSELFAELMADKEPLLICAAGGANTAAEYGYAPTLVIGDLDSLGDAARAAVPEDQQISVLDQNATDMEKVLLHAVDVGVQTANLIGFTGRRTDHTLWNLSQLKRFGDRMCLRLLDDYCEIRVLEEGCTRFHADPGQKLSLCPLAGPVSGIVTRGLKWELRGETLGPDRAGISNEVTACPVEIAVEEGDLLLVIQRDSAADQVTLL